jgi:DNA-binding response OmpR family regulator
MPWVSKVYRLIGPKVLVVEDDPSMRRLVQAVLESDNYTVSTATTGEEALGILDSWHPQLILLDVLFPGCVDGFELCRVFRALTSAPIIMLTGKSAIEDKVRGFDAGADDYVTKPFASKELLARARAVLRRSTPPEELEGQKPIVCGRWHIDPIQGQVSLDGREISLTSTEFRLLAELARNANSFVPHERLLEAVWGPEYRDEVQYLRTYIRRLRSKVEQDGSRFTRLLSKTNVGYMLVAD